MKSFLPRLAFLFTASAVAAGPVSLTIDVANPAGKVSPIHSGLMTEDINHCFDGGLYAELIQNRVFKDDPQSPAHWSPVNGATISLDSSTPLSSALGTSLLLTASGAHAGIANDGYWGIPVKPSTTYNVSFYANPASSFLGKLSVGIESEDGTSIYTAAEIPQLTKGWHQYNVTLSTTSGVTPTTKARFVIRLDSPGAVRLNLVSLFPPTFKDQPNGFRPDLMQMLVDLHPSFLRFPGGNFLEGDTIDQRFKWKETLGPLTDRPGHRGPWGYRSTDGMGLMEFFTWCEDMNAEPVLAIYAGYSLRGMHVNPGKDLQPYIDDALDELEYVTGSTTSKWGAERAKDGHPAPYTLHYVEIGNEDWFDKSLSYSARFKQFADAIKAKYPDLKLISTVGNEQPAEKRVHDATPGAVDEHYYRAAADFQNIAATRFEAYKRSGPEIFVGEWAAYEDILPWAKGSATLARTPAFKAALGDAAWMAAMERNSDIITMQCYAPLFVNLNKGASQWRPDLIGYDALTSYGSPSYYAIQLFNTNRGDTILKSSLTGLPTGVPTIHQSVTQDSKTHSIYIKLVNFSPTPQPVEINLKGATSINPTASVTTLSAKTPADTNSLENPKNIIPVPSKIQDAKPTFTYPLPPYSITALKLDTM